MWIYRRRSRPEARGCLPFSTLSCTPFSAQNDPKYLLIPCISTAYTFSEAADTLFTLSDRLLIQPNLSIDLVQAIYIKYIVV